MNRKEYQHKYYLEHKEKYAESVRKFYEKHPHYGKERYLKNKKYMEAFKERNPNYFKEYMEKRKNNAN